MTRIDFHILQSDQRQQMLEYTCRLTEKATNQGHQVMIFTDGQETSATLDTLLWSHRPESFVPHSRSPNDQAPVYITHEQEPGNFHDVLLSLHGGEPPAFYSRFNRAIEIVSQQPTLLKQSRKNYSFYKTRGYEIKTHKVNI